MVVQYYFIWNIGRRPSAFMVRLEAGDLLILDSGCWTFFIFWREVLDLFGSVRFLLNTKERFGSPLLNKMFFCCDL
jgi:hypothetical protein